MTTYLTIITTVLVLTQIIRLMQNAMQLSRLNNKNNELTDILEEIRKNTDKIEIYLYRLCRKRYHREDRRKEDK
jgi:hypothetical protein